MNALYVVGSFEPAQTLDLYLPTEEGPFPVVLWVHGGGWCKGGKALDRCAPALRVLERGYALASVNYRLSYQAHFPAQIHDMKTAVRYLRAHAAEHNLDPEHIGVWGASAGGHLAALLGTSGSVTALEDLSRGYQGESSRVQAVVDWFGPTSFLLMQEQAEANGCELRDNSKACPPCEQDGHGSPCSPASKLIGAPIQEERAKAKAASPISYVTADDPPFLIEHGTQDCDVPYQQSQLLHEALVNAIGSEKATLVLLPAGHGAAEESGDPFNDEKNIDLVLDFFDR